MKARPGPLEELYDLHIDEAVRLGYLLTGDEQIAQDLAHEGFVRVLTRFADLRRKDSFPAYLRRTIVNLARDRYRRGVLQRRYEYTKVRTDIPSDQPDIGLRDGLWRALQLLPPRQKAAVVLRYYEDLSEAQVGEVMDCSAGAVKSLVARGMEKLREVVGEMELS